MGICNEAAKAVRVKITSIDSADGTSVTKPELQEFFHALVGETIAEDDAREILALNKSLSSQEINYTVMKFFRGYGMISTRDFTDKFASKYAPGHWEIKQTSRKTYKSIFTPDNKNFDINLDLFNWIFNRPFSC